MIKAIIFDFGNVFINLDIPGAIQTTFKALNIESFTEDLIAQNDLYEKGLISTETFIDFYKSRFSHLSNTELVDIWNCMLKDFPEHRLEFLKQLKAEGNYQLILLSNTNELHINWIKENVPFYEDFKNCFDAFYLSQEIQLKKPNKDIFEFVLKENNLKAEDCFFIDDNTDNINTANQLNIKTWHINPETEDVTRLFEIQNHIF